MPTPSSEYAITAQGLAKSYRLRHSLAPYRTLREMLTTSLGSLGRRTETETFWALRDATFTVKRGEVLGIVGRNGAGKSTLLKILCRIVAPTRGEARVLGRVGSLLEVGTGFHPELTGRENIFLNGAILGMRRREIQAQFDAIVDFAEIDRFLDTPVKRYSSGMYVRLAFAVAAHLNPDILLVDEVLAVGDTAFQKKCVGKMEEVTRGAGRTVLFVTHNMGIVTQLCTTSMLLRAGEVAMVGATDAVVRSYLTEGASDAGEVVFGPPRTRGPVALTRCWLNDSEGARASLVDVRKSFVIGVEVSAPSRVRDVELSVAVYDTYGRRVFTSNYSDASDSLPVLEGVHRFGIRVPGDFLAPGSYSITVAAHRPHAAILDQRDAALRFEVEETGSHMARYPVNSYGVVLVRLPWTTESTSAPTAPRTEPASRG